MTERTYKLDELARAAGISARTVRYYVQRGLLPAAAFRGKDTAYRHAHLARLRAIRRLQEAYLPLDAIAAELDGRDLGAIERIAEGRAKPASRSGVAVEPVHAREPSVADDEDVRAKMAREVSRVFRRIELFPGVDLTVADDAPEKSVRLVEQMLDMLEAMSRAKEGARRR